MCGSIQRQVQKYVEMSGNHLPWISIRKYPEIYGDFRGGIYGVIQKCPEHTASQAISALICKKARISDYQHMHGVTCMVQSTTLPIVKTKHLHVQTKSLCYSIVNVPQEFCYPIQKLRKTKVKILTQNHMDVLTC